MSKLPIVSVVCSCYNHKDYIIETLNAVVNQTYKNIELIVVDDCSHDNSVQVINEWLIDFPNVQFIQNPKNLGLNKSFNQAVKMSKGAYLIDLAADDLMLPNFVEDLMTVFLSENKQELALAFGNASEINENGEVLATIIGAEMVPKVHKAIAKGYYPYLLGDSKYICSVSAMYNRTVFEELGGYDENLHFEDFDFWLRATRNYKIAFIEKMLIHKIVLENSMGSGFHVRKKASNKLQESFYKIVMSAYKTAENKDEYKALLLRISTQAKWSLKNLNFDYFYRYVLLFFTVGFKVVRSFLLG